MRAPVDEALNAPAILSDDERHRFWLRRSVRTLDAPAGESLVVFVMLNPSTADAQVDDPTIRRCKGFAARWGFSDLGVVNLWSLRATNPAELERWDWRADYAARARNQLIIDLACERAGLVIGAWGATVERVDVPWPLLQAPDGFYCLGTTKSGQPRHPLYVAGATEREIWRAA